MGRKAYQESKKRRRMLHGLVNDEEGELIDEALRLYREATGEACSESKLVREAVLARAKYWRRKYGKSFPSE